MKDKFISYLAKFDADDWRLLNAIKDAEKISIIEVIRKAVREKAVRLKLK